MDIKTLLLLTPVLLIQLVLIIISLVNIIKKKKTKYLNKPIWIVLILFITYIGSICYLVIEGTDSSEGEDDESN